MRSVDWTGIVSANGGNNSPTSTGAASGGGGGRIAIYYNDISGFDVARVSAYGGANPNFKGGAGTIYLKSFTQTYGDLIVNNNDTATSGFSTPLVSLGTGVSTDLTIDTLTDTTANWNVNGLTGIYLNPNINQGTTPATVFKIILNDATSITVNNTPYNMTDIGIGATGDTYIGEHYIDNLSVVSGAKVKTLDRIIYNNLDITGGELQADDLVSDWKGRFDTRYSLFDEGNSQRVKDGSRLINKEELGPGEVNKIHIIKDVSETRKEIKIINKNKEFDAQKVKLLIPKQKHDEETKAREFIKDNVPDSDRDTARANVVTEEVSG